MNRIFNHIPRVLFINLIIIFSGMAFNAGAQYNYDLAIPSQNVSVNYDNANITYNDFYQDLSPYGQWIEDPKYGYVWSPDVEGSFRPYYTNGHWALTEYGNTWISDYAWGWACFHYGRWTFDKYYGWLWIPGSTWGPSWVCWRYTDGYEGWAPFDPAYDLGSALDFSCPNDWWVFIPPQYLYTGNYYRYWNGPRNNKDFLHNSTIVNNVYENNHIKYVNGPRGKDIEGYTHKPVDVFHLANSSNLNTKTHLNVIKMYRPPQVMPVSNINGQRVAPPNVVGAPQQINTPQSVTGHANATPEFRNNLPKTQEDVPGTHFIEPQKANPQPRNNTNPYEWDVNTPSRQPQQQPHQQQPQPQQQQPQNHAQPQSRPISRPASTQPRPTNSAPARR
jgi:hypothetical protein